MCLIRCLALAFIVTVGWSLDGNYRLAAQHAAQPWQMSGYLLVPNERVGVEYGGGFSMYVAAWPLLMEYPGNRFQSGLFGTWMLERTS